MKGVVNGTEVVEVITFSIRVKRSCVVCYYL